MSHQAKGTFDVKMIPQAEESGGKSVGRYLIDKTYSGDLQGTGKGQMLGAGAPDKGNAGYVAMETVSGTLDGRAGTFVIQQSGLMTGGTLEQTVVIAPGTGTGELEGILGKMTITVESGKHHYTLEYMLPEK